MSRPNTPKRSTIIPKPYLLSFLINSKQPWKHRPRLEGDRPFCGHLKTTTVSRLVRYRNCWKACFRPSPPVLLLLLHQAAATASATSTTFFLLPLLNPKLKRLKSRHPPELQCPKGEFHPIPHHCYLDLDFYKKTATWHCRRGRASACTARPDAPRPRSAPTFGGACA